MHTAYVDHNLVNQHIVLCHLHDKLPNQGVTVAPLIGKSHLLFQSQFLRYYVNIQPSLYFWLTQETISRLRAREKETTPPYVQLALVHG